MHDTTPARAHRCTRVDAICVLLLIAYFLHFALAARHGGFREDEMMNMGSPAGKPAHSNRSWQTSYFGRES